MWLQSATIVVLLIPSAVLAQSRVAQPSPRLQLQESGLTADRRAERIALELSATIGVLAVAAIPGIVTTLSVGGCQLNCDLSDSVGIGIGFGAGGLVAFALTPLIERAQVTPTIAILPSGVLVGASGLF